MEAFAIFSLIVVSHFSKDLLQYHLLFLLTYRHFSGRVWLAYDQVWFEHAAASHLMDWSLMNVQLFNFHAAGSSVRSNTLAQANESPKPLGSSSSSLLCKSWNKGRCTALFASCWYAHHCSMCSGSHCSTACSRLPSGDSSEEPKHCSRSSSASGFSRTKACCSWLCFSSFFSIVCNNSALCTFSVPVFFVCVFVHRSFLYWDSFRVIVYRCYLEFHSRGVSALPYKFLYFQPSPRTNRVEFYCMRPTVVFICALPLFRVSFLSPCVCRVPIERFAIHSGFGWAPRSTGSRIHSRGPSAWFLFGVSTCWEASGS